MLLTYKMQLTEFKFKKLKFHQKNPKKGLDNYDIIKPNSMLFVSESGLDQELFKPIDVGQIQVKIINLTLHHDIIHLFHFEVVVKVIEPYVNSWADLLLLLLTFFAVLSFFFCQFWKEQKKTSLCTYYAIKIHIAFVFLHQILFSCKMLDCAFEFYPYVYVCVYEFVIVWLMAIKHLVIETHVHV